MTASISTYGTNGGTVDTPYENGESVEDWVKHHTDQVTDQSSSGEELETAWTAEEDKVKVTTDRIPNESDAAFVARHEIEALLVMLQTPPVP